MPASGNIQGTVSRNPSRYVFRAAWWETDINTAANTSVLHCVVYLDVYRYKFSTSYGSWSLTMNNEEVLSQNNKYITYGDNSSNPATYMVIAEQTKTIAHDSDGSKSVVISAAFGTGSGSYAPGDCSLSESVTLTQIARNSTISSVPESVQLTGDTNGTGVNTVVTPRAINIDVGLSHPVAGSTYDITVGVWQNGAYVTGTTITSSGSSAVTTHSFSLDSTMVSKWLAAVPNVTSGIARVSLTTKVNDAQIGDTVTRDITFKVDTAVFRLYPVDTLLWNIRDNKTTQLEWVNVHLTGQSEVTIGLFSFDGTAATVIADPANTCGGGGYASYRFVWEDGTIAAGREGRQSWGYDYTLDPTNMLGLHTLTMEIFDSRGTKLVHPRKANLRYQAYNAPVLSQLEANRAIKPQGGEIQLDESGDGVELTYTTSISPLYNVNADGVMYGENANSVASIRYRVAEDNGAPFGAYTNVPDDGFITGMDTDKRYLIELEITDQIMSASQQTYLSTAFFTVHFKAGGKAVGLLRSATQLADGKVGVGGDLLIGDSDDPKSIVLNGNPLAPGTVALPISDNLTTDRADRALSARQGVVLKGAVDAVIYDVNTPSGSTPIRLLTPAQYDELLQSGSTTTERGTIVYDDCTLYITYEDDPTEVINT